MAKSPRPRKPLPADPTPPAPQTEPGVRAGDQQVSAPEPSAPELAAPSTPKPVRAPRVSKAAVTPAAPALDAGSEAQASGVAKAPVKKATARKAAAKKAAPTRSREPTRSTAKVPAAPKAVSPAAPRIRKARTLAEAVQAPVAPAVPPAPVVAAPATMSAAPAESLANAAVPSVGRHGHGAPLRILMVASEAVPFAKTGGLADVVAALPKALGALGHDVTVVIPRYRGIPVAATPTTSFVVEMGGHHYQADVFVQQTSPGVRVALVDHPAFFDRDALYGLGSHDYADNPRRFGFLCLAALEFARIEGVPVDVVHAHDWQGGLAPVYVKTRYAADPVLGGAATIFTIHNIAYQGNCSSDWLPQLGLGWDVFTSEGLEFWLHASLLKGGIMFSDLVTTVSPRYAEELMTPEFAFGFEGILRHRVRRTWRASSTASTPTSGTRRPIATCPAPTRPMTCRASRTPSGCCWRPTACREATT